MIFYVFANGNFANHQKYKAPQGLAPKEIMWGWWQVISEILLIAKHVLTQPMANLFNFWGVQILVGKKIECKLVFHDPKCLSKCHLMQKSPKDLATKPLCVFFCIYEFQCSEKWKLHMFDTFKTHVFFTSGKSKKLRGKNVNSGLLGCCILKDQELGFSRLFPVDGIPGSHKWR